MHFTHEHEAAVALDAALQALIGLAAHATAPAEHARTKILRHESLGDEDLERCLQSVVDLAVQSARIPVSRAASFEVARALRGFVEQRAPTGMLAVRRLITGVFESGDAWEETTSEALGVLAILASIGQSPPRMQLAMLCHALSKLKRWGELEAWSNVLLHESQRFDDWKSELHALELLADSTEATGRPATALRARDQMLAILGARGRKLTAPAAAHMLAEAERLRAIVAALPEGSEPTE